MTNTMSPGPFVVSPSPVVLSVLLCSAAAPGQPILFQLGSRSVAGFVRVSSSGQLFVGGRAVRQGSRLVGRWQRSLDGAWAAAEALCGFPLSVVPSV